jgi:hypothetical protein
VLPLHEATAAECRRDIFHRNGRWALIAVSVFYLLSLLETIYFWKEPLKPVWTMLNITLIVLPLISFFAPRRIYRFTTVLSFLLTLCFVFVDVAIPVPT